MDKEELMIYNRSDIVNFMNTGTTAEPIYTRMKGFTTGGKELNSKTDTPISEQSIVYKIEKKSEETASVTQAQESVTGRYKDDDSRYSLKNLLMRQEQEVHRED